MREDGQQHHRQHRPGSDAARKRCFSQSARAQRPSTNSSSKALQWAQAVCTKTAAGRGGGRPPRLASCPSRRRSRGPDTACLRAATDVEGRLCDSEGRRGCGSSSTSEACVAGVGGGGDPSQTNHSNRLGDARGNVEYRGRQGDLGRGKVACASESPSSVGTDGRAVGGAWLNTTGVSDEVNEYSTDGDGYSDDSFAPDGDNFGTCRNHEEHHRSDCEHHKVDAIPSTLVETGRGADD